MALFKIFKGKASGLNAVPLHEGYAYFTEDEGTLWVDISSEPGGRVQVNAYSAETLRPRQPDGTLGNEIDIDDLLLKDATIGISSGGTGKDTLEINALLVGNGTEPVKLVKIDNGQILLGSSTNGVKGLSGTGALYALTADAPQFGTLPLDAGGTGATNAAGARNKLEVYSQDETDIEVGKVTSLAWNFTLEASGWQGTGPYTYTYSNTALKCGKANNVPPIITYTSNQTEYSKIEKAEATPGVGIVFTIQEKPENDIGIIITDNR